MALRIKINITEDNSGPLGKWADLLDQIDARKGQVAPLETTYIRMPGTSQNGPCAECAQFFFMEHDGSGREVPTIPVHQNCVCLDMPKALVDLTPDAPEPQPKGGWIENVATDEQKKQILGQTRANLLASGAASVADLYSRTGPLSYASTLAHLARKLSKASKARLVKAARDAGVEVSRKMTRQQLINVIAKRNIA